MQCEELIVSDFLFFSLFYTELVIIFVLHGSFPGGRVDPVSKYHIPPSYRTSRWNRM